MSNSINFLPEDYLENKARQRMTVIGLVLFVLVVSGVGFGFVLSNQRQQRMQDRINVVNQKLTAADDTLKKLEELDKKRLQMLDKAKISALLMEPVPRSLILATITNNLPSDCALTDFNLVSKEIKKSPAPKAKTTRTSRSSSSSSGSSSAAKTKKPEETTEDAVKEYESTIQITGLASDDHKVAQLISNLNRSSLFSSVDLLYSEEHQLEQMNLKRFVIKTVIAPSTQATPDAVEWARRQHVEGM